MALPCGLRPICFLGLTLHEEWLGYAFLHFPCTLAGHSQLLPFCGRRADQQEQQRWAIVGALQDQWLHPRPALGMQDLD